MELLKRAIIIILAFILILSDVSCSSSDKEQGEKAVLSIYVMDYDGNAQNAVDNFNKNHKNVQIKPELFDGGQVPEFESRLKSGLASGEGPDIIYTDTYKLPGLMKYIDGGAFLDLNEIIKEDRDFKLSDYNGKILDFGLSGDKRYLMPLNFMVGGMAATERTMDKYGLDTGESLTIGGIAGTVKKYMSDNPGGGKYFFSNLDFGSVVLNSGTPSVKPENGKAEIDRTRFPKLMRAYKEIYPSILPEDEYRKNSNHTASLENGETAVDCTYFIGFNAFKMAYSKYASGTELRIIPALSADSGAIVSVMPYAFAAVNSKCKDTGAAFEFIKTLLSKEFQYNENTNYFPINLEAYEAGRTECAGAGGGMEELTGQLDGMIKNIGLVKADDDEIRKMVNEGVKGFISGVKTEEETVKTIQDAINTYLGGLSTETATAQSAETAGDSGAAAQSNETGKKSEVQLKISYLNNQKYIDSAAILFNGKYPDIEIVKDVYPYTAFEEFKNKLATSLMSGSGPDIIAFDWRYFNSLYKVVQNGTFCELNGFIEGDSEFKQADYNSAMWDWGVYDGKRYFVPLSGSINVMVTSEKTLKQSNISIDRSGWTLKTLQNVVKNFMQNKRDSNKYFFCYDDLYLSRIINWSGVSFIDYKVKKSKFNSKEFLDLLEIYKDIESAVSPLETAKTKEERLMSEGRIVMFPMSMTPSALWGVNSAFKAILNEEVDIYPVPVYKEGDKTRVKLSDGAAINQSCKNKKAAYEFIKVLMSEECQSSEYNGNPNILGIQLNKQGYEKQREMSLSSGNGRNLGSSNGWGAFERYDSVSLPEQLLFKFDNLIKNITPGDIIDEEIYKIIEEEGALFIAGKKSAEQTAKTIDGKVTLFLNE
jgi:ABC-type glycerol-3-phosphate transport system substrate-binding protein